MSDILLATKLFLPPLPANALQRKRLWERLDQGLAPENRLVLVCAPAGYGKTTLVSEWLHKLPGLEAAWVSLGAEDNDPGEFFALLAAGLEKSRPGARATLAALLQSPQPLAPQALAAALLNEVARQSSPLILVLDDYQLIGAQAVHEGVAFLVDHLPPGVHVVLVSRSDPPLPLHRYRGRGQMVEVRQADLRFTPPEISHLVQALAGYRLNGAEAAILEERTEGWAAGVQMAGLSLRGRADAGRFIHSLSGSQRYFLDYLAEEVLNSQPPEIQRFLLATSILDHFCAGLCDWILAAEGADPEAGRAVRRPARSILDELEKANLFIIPLDDAGEWYRYHHLFHDLLQLRLKDDAQSGGVAQSGEGRAVADLHRRAAAWFEQQGLVGDAVQHAILAGDHEKAAGLVERHTLALFSQGELARLVGWVKLLPEAAAGRRPWLRIYQAWASVFAGRVAEAEALLQQAERALAAGGAAGPAGVEAAQQIQAEAAGIRGVAAIMSGKIEAALALESLPEEVRLATHPFARCGIYWALGYAWRMRGESGRALALFGQMRETAREHHLLWTQITAAIDLGNLLRMTGKLRQAVAVYREALEEAARAGAGDVGFLGRLESFLANALYEQNELEEARWLALASLAHNRVWQTPNHSVHGYLVWARVVRRLGDPAAAREALSQAEAAAGQGGIVPPLRAMLEVARLKSWLAAGELAPALEWAHARAGEAAPGGPYDEAQEQIGVGLARVELALGKRAEAFERLAGLAANAEGRGLVNPLVEMLTLQALAAPDQATAMRVVGRALALGLPEGYQRTYLDEGPALVDLLHAYRRAAGLDPELRVYLERLLAGAEGAPEGEEAGQPARGGLLSARELEILRLMAEGLSNAEIGQRLFISPGTVKAHSAAIYRKLEVANRSAAVGRAKEGGLI